MLSRSGPVYGRLALPGESQLLFLFYWPKKLLFQSGKKYLDFCVGEWLQDKLTFWVVPGNSAAGPHMLPNVHKPGIVCTRPTLHLLFLTSLETTRTRTRLEHKAQDSTSPALLRLQQQE